VTQKGGTRREGRVEGSESQRYRSQTGDVVTPQLNIDSKTDGFTVACPTLSEYRRGRRGSTCSMPGHAPGRLIRGYGKPLRSVFAACGVVYWRVYSGDTPRRGRVNALTPDVVTPA